MRIVDIGEASAHFSKLLDDVIQGEEILIAIAGKSVAKLGPIGKSQRRFGVLKGKMKISKDFDAPLAAVFERF